MNESSVNPVEMPGDTDPIDSHLTAQAIAPTKIAATTQPIENKDRGSGCPQPNSITQERVFNRNKCTN